MRFENKDTLIDFLIPGDLPSDKILSHIEGFDHAGLVVSLARQETLMIEMSGNLQDFPHDKSGMEFHVSRQARDLYQFDQVLFSLSGNVIFANFYGARIFAQKMNERRDLVNFPEQAVRAGQINAMGLIDEILHLVVNLYKQQRNLDIWEQALAWLNEKVGKDKVDITLLHFVDEFPPMAVYRREKTVKEYFEGESMVVTPGISAEKISPNREIILEELLMLWLANKNQAFTPFMELFNDANLNRETAYKEIFNGLSEYFETAPPFGPENQNLVDMLRSPAVAIPHSLSGQLDYIRERWGYLLGKYLYRLLTSLDLIREEEKTTFLGPGPSIPYDFTGLEFELERFTPDRDWMPSLVLMAKNAYVWLDQLSKAYKEEISRLDQIPDREIDRLVGWGISGLWLIGLWERSKASKRIKQLRGQHDAEASAYSLFEYQIAEDLGGEDAYNNLRQRAWKRGIRLASDMVPNHMGIDSRWVVEHPDWFLSLDTSPFPSYTFNGPDLSWDERVGIYLEDHYYDNTDAAVVFKRFDRLTGDKRYIYHGNDGTSMPWNDTAQLNYLLPEVREAVIQTVLHVARKFPIIRFDAAMTLAKKHYQRLWFPEPGAGGAIPSRAEHGLTKAQFDAAIPHEFWREVVDRIAREVPDTLLLAEAFWLMEGYFVRTLGMHRVYNSAFMHMLRDEKNQEYRLVIKNTLEFDPEILKRYVNFMNNPDEETAIAQFGKGDKYFGVCTMLATMPGLPMFGHGQVEGFTEKYGMEFRRAYWDEKPDPYLIERHEREIFPLLHRRRLFAEVSNFSLYDFVAREGYVNEDVFAYSNRHGEERSLVIYHNKYAQARGWIRTSAAYAEKSAVGEKALVQKSLGEGLGLDKNEDTYIIFRDQINGLQYIRKSTEIYNEGLYIELGAYKCHVFLDFHQVKDEEWRQYGQLAAYLNGRGVPNIEDALKELYFQPVHIPFRSLVNADLTRMLVKSRLSSPEDEVDQQLLAEIEAKFRRLLEEIGKLLNSSTTQTILDDTVDEIRRNLEACLALSIIEERFPMPASLTKWINKRLAGHIDEKPLSWGALAAWVFVHLLWRVQGDEVNSEVVRSWIDEWLLGRIIYQQMRELGASDEQAWLAVDVVKFLTTFGNWALQRPDDGKDNRSKRDVHAYRLIESMLRDVEVQRYLQINRYQGVLWFNKEAFEQMIDWMMVALWVTTLADKDINDEGRIERILAGVDILKQIQAAVDESGYQVERLFEAIKH